MTRTTSPSNPSRGVFSCPNPSAAGLSGSNCPTPQGQNPKCRPVVILTATEEIKAGEPMVGVAISTTFDPRVPQGHVELPWHRGGHPRTGLKQRSAALCTWLVEFEESSIQEYGGVVPGKKLVEILEKVAALE